MSRLPTPIRQTLREIRPSEGEVARMWSSVLLRSEPPRRELQVAALTLALACALALLAWPAHWRNSLGRAPQGTDAGPLYMADGQPIGGLAHQASTHEAHAVALSDGSQLMLAPGTTLALLENNGQRFEVLLQRGHADFKVRPGGPRRWIIEGGLATVEVVGTQFSVDRQSGLLEVRVTEGVVLVHGELVPGRVQRLRSGAVLSVAQPKAEPQVAPSPGHAQPTPTPKVLVAPPTVASKKQATPPVPQWRTLAQEHDYHQAWDALGHDGVRKQLTLPLSIDELLTLCDVARLSGHPAAALPLLEQAIVHFPKDKRVALLAFTRGRIYFDDLHQPDRAAQAFAQALALGLPRALSEDAYALLVESRARAADRAGARDAAKQYDALFPNGRFHERIARWVQAP